MRCAPHATLERSRYQETRERPANLLTCAVWPRALQVASAEIDAPYWQPSAGFHCANIPLGLGVHAHTCKS